MKNVCKHYHARPGLRYECELGVDIRALVGGSDYGWLTRMPCVTTSLSREQVTCERRCYQTAEELAAEEAEMMRVLEAFASGKSPCCGAGLVAVGSFHYCEACRKFVAHTMVDRSGEP
jgi:hypothetical protein